MRIEEAEFTKAVSGAMLRAWADLAMAPWSMPTEHPEQREKNNGKPQSDGMGMFLSPLEAGIGAIGRLAWKSMEDEINRELNRDIYKV